MKKKCIFFLIILCIVLIAITIWLAFHFNNKYTFVKPEFDISATKEELQVSKELQYAELNIAEGYKVYICGNLIIDSNGKIPIYFKSDKNNNVYIKFRIYDENNNMLIESGLIKPGETIQYLESNQIKQETNINIKIMSYDPNTYFSRGVANLKSKIKIAGEKNI